MAERATAAARAHGSRHEHRGGPRPAAPGLPGRDHPQDPLPRGQGPDQARAHAVRLPQVLRRGRRPAALRAADAARPLPAAAGDRRAPRRHRPRAGAAADRAGRPDRADRWRWPPTGCPAPSRSRRRDHLRLSRKELLKIAEISEDLLDQLEQYGLVTPRRGTGHYDTDALVIATTARELAEFGFEPRHLRAFKTAADREVGLVEQVVAPHKRGRDAAARARAEETVSEIAALSVRLHATLVKAGLALSRLNRSTSGRRRRCNRSSDAPRSGRRARG